MPANRTLENGHLGGEGASSRGKQCSSPPGQDGGNAGLVLVPKFAGVICACSSLPAGWRRGCGVAPMERARCRGRSGLGGGRCRHGARNKKGAPYPTAACVWLSLCTDPGLRRFSLLLVGNIASVFSLSKGKNMLRHVKGFFFFVELPSTLLPANPRRGKPASPPLPNSRLDASQTALGTTQAAFGGVPARKQQSW